ncbi:hypothetical protein EAS61_26965 [Bradyrhizobium zhanjiangense]|uniref:Uncharacterized protein n=1 Tax=Bradyrhizobium zhanjiangense TaxID=1325107 RepID=A0A4Q0QG27_9BRAD|nr:hypothetical protein EAS61_26965 [Bradyrhizobium zhanjiangense]
MLRHCEEPLRRSNPESCRGLILDCFAALAMPMWRRRAPHCALVPPTQRCVTLAMRSIVQRRCAAEPGPMSLRRTVWPWIPALRRNRCASGT